MFIPTFTLNAVKIRQLKHLFLILLVLMGSSVLVHFGVYKIRSMSCELNKRLHSNNTKIIVITPTYRRSTRLPELTRLKNTLSNIKDIFWIIVEDGNTQAPVVTRMLEKSAIPHVYLAYKTIPGYPKRGWYQRDMALRYLSDNVKNVIGHYHAVVYFADDDNAYDSRLFTEYIRNVELIGVWAVGLVGGSPVESPRVDNGKVTGWHVVWNPKRRFAIDMAGFAVSFKLVMESKARFGKECKKGDGSPETCFLEKMNLQLTDLEPFGFDRKKEREVLVWHTQSVTVKYDKRKADLYGYMIE